MSKIGTQEAIIPENELALAAALGHEPTTMQWRKPLSIVEINRMAPTAEVRARQGRP